MLLSPSLVYVAVWAASASAIAHSDGFFQVQPSTLSPSFASSSCPANSPASCSPNADLSNLCCYEYPGVSFGNLTDKRKILISFAGSHLFDAGLSVFFLSVTLLMTHVCACSFGIRTLPVGLQIVGLYTVSLVTRRSLGCQLILASLGLWPNQ